MQSQSTRHALEVFARHGGIVRTRDVLGERIHPRTLYRLRDEGLVKEIERGLFVAVDRELVWHPAVVATALKQPLATLCLISALEHWEIGTQIAHYVHIALPRGVRAPRLSHGIRVYHWSGEALTDGVVTETVDGVPVRVYEPAKTVVDCFRARYKIGIDVAIEALKDCLDRRVCRPDEIEKYSRQLGVATVMRPYLEMAFA